MSAKPTSLDRHSSFTTPEFTSTGPQKKVLRSFSKAFQPDQHQQPKRLPLASLNQPCFDSQDPEATPSLVHVFADAIGSGHEFEKSVPALDPKSE
jgi:hypothetical protein